MINLLPETTKKQIRAARMNTVLVRYVLITTIAGSFLTLACIMSYVLLVNVRATLEELSERNALQSTTGSNSAIQLQADTVRTNLAITKGVLDQQISYTNIITNLASALPAGTMLNSLTLNDGSIGTTTTLKIHAISSDKETTLKQNILQRQNIFSNYSLVSSVTDSNAPSGYPITITISITINKVANL